MGSPEMTKPASGGFGGSETERWKWVRRYRGPGLHVLRVA
ncbi:hypothetical protein LHGZ1_2945 [Laribacter hongkongensis]|uniref:Uncharacterized protein n=1 Tax=Laribacter hongkongensis TaxID=168471 RepID=A0A248LN35_9NEIS|nr:hypothetical protein LHGZ1_2945 [Laribacter hongkongensis]